MGYCVPYCLLLEHPCTNNLIPLPAISVFYQCVGCCLVPPFCCSNQPRTDPVVLQVSRAVDYVGGGTKALVEAKTLQRNKRKWCCVAIIILLIIVIVVVVVVSDRAISLLP